MVQSALALGSVLLPCLVQPEGHVEAFLVPLVAAQEALRAVLVIERDQERPLHDALLGQRMVDHHEARLDAFLVAHVNGLAIPVAGHTAALYLWWGMGGRQGSLFFFFSCFLVWETGWITF